MSIDDILLLVFFLLISGGIGVGMAKFSQWVRQKQEKKVAQEIWEGKRKQVVNIDGERIHIKKFKWKTPEGEIETHPLA